MTDFFSRRDVLKAGAAAVAASFSPLALAHRIMPLKSRNIGKCQLAVMDVDTPEFGAAMQGGKHLARIEQTLGVERTLQPLLLGEIDVAKHFRHEVAFFDAVSSPSPDDVSTSPPGAMGGRQSTWISK